MATKTSAAETMRSDSVDHLEAEIPDARLIASEPENPSNCRYLASLTMDLKRGELPEPTGPFAARQESLASAATVEESFREASMRTILGSFPFRKAGPTEEQEALASKAR